MEWVSFDEIKKAVTLRMVIDRYGIRLKQVGPQTLRGRCPLPTHTSEKSKESFTATLDKGQGGAWVCQSRSCINARGARKGGNVLDFVAAMEQCSVREAAVKLQQWFSVPVSGGEPEARQAGAAARTPVPEPAAQPREELVSKEKEPTAGESTGNQPLSFTLKDIDPSHPYIGERGIDRKTADLFGIGFFPGRGSMQGRVVIPIHNERGELLAYAGRSIDGTEPKYKFPAGFHKSLELYNLHRAVQDNGPRMVVIVEGFFDCMKVYQAGFPVVALMGSSMSEQQEKLLVSNFQAAILLLDGDEAGRTGAWNCAERLVQRMFVRVVRLDFGKQPDMLPADELRELLLGGDE